jgi:UDP-sugar transporter A1/2/3
MAAGGQESSRKRQALVSLLVVFLIAHKSTTDVLANWTRQQGAFSGLSAVILSEFIKFPLIAFAIGSTSGWASVGPTFRQSLVDKPYITAIISLLYSAQNAMYFPALSNLSAASYQILSQSRVIFTAGLMFVWLKTALGVRRVFALLLLIVGSVLVQLSESASAGGGNALYGAGLTVLSALLAAIANVWNEKILKSEGENMWVRSLQITFWCSLWLAIFELPKSVMGGSAILNLSGFTTQVWIVVGLKALNGILVPLAFKYADNILYQYAKQAAIVVSIVFASIVAQTLPSVAFLCGAVVVLVSMVAY